MGTGVGVGRSELDINLGLGITLNGIGKYGFSRWTEEGGN